MIVRGAGEGGGDPQYPILDSGIRRANESKNCIFVLQCRADHASRVLFEMINEQPTKIALIGAGCSVVSERIAEEAKTWNLITVSNLACLIERFHFNETK